MGLTPLSFGGDRDPFDLARETLGKAQGIRCLDSGSKERLSGYQRDLSIMACEDLASNGSAAGWAVANCVQNLKLGLAQDLQQAAILSNGGSMEQMNTVSNALARVNAIPGKMQQVDQERQKIQQQQLQQLQQTQQLMHQVLSGGSSAAAATPPGAIPGTAQASGGVFSMGSYGGSSSSVVPPLPGTTPLPTQ